MIPIAAGLLAFAAVSAAAFAAWRWGLGSENRIEGGIVAVVAVVVAGLTTHALLRAAAIAAGG